MVQPEVALGDEFGPAGAIGDVHDLKFCRRNVSWDFQGKEYSRQSWLSIATVRLAMNSRLSRSTTHLDPFYLW